MPKSDSPRAISEYNSGNNNQVLETRQATTQTCQLDEVIITVVRYSAFHVLINTDTNGSNTLYS